MKTLFIDTFEIAVPMSVLIGALLIISPLIKKSFVAKWRYFMWLFVALRLIFPFKIQPIAAPITVEIPKSLQTVTAVSAAAHRGAQTAPVSVQSVLMLIWLLGTGVFVLRQVIAYFTFKRSVRRWSADITDEGVTDILEEIRASLSIRRKIKFMTCKTVNTPMVFGLIKPVLLLPRQDYSERELRVILRHEMVHFKRNDILYKLILLTANAICWFNPLVYKMVDAANKDIEMACDAEVVKEKGMDYRRDYCMVILNVVHNKRSITAPLSTCFVISKEVIRERFSGILDTGKKRRGVVMFVIVALSVAVSGSLVSFAAEKTARVLEDDLNIVERPTPKPEPTATAAPEPTPEPEADNVGDYGDYVSDVPEYEPSDVYDDASDVPEVSAEVEEPVSVPEVQEKTRVDLREQSNQMDINFNGAGEVYSSSASFTGDSLTDMVLVGNGSFTLQVVDDATGDVVYEQEMTDENSYAEVPMSDGGEYSVNAVGGEVGGSASLYVYGK